MTDVRRINELKLSKVITLGDILTVVVVAILSLLVAIPTFFPKQKGSEVEISINGTATRYELSTDREISLDGMVVVIKNGEVFVKSVNCPDKICYHTGKISATGEKIVCTPKGVVITITGDSEFNADTGGGV